jgi:hypothetical protein
MEVYDVLPPTELTPEQHAEIASQIDLSGKVDKETGKGLSTNDLTDILKTNYNEAYGHSQSTHAPSDAQVNNISDVNAALLIGGQEINLHSHSGSGGLSQQQIEGLI